MRNRFVYDGWIRFKPIIMLTFLYLSVIIENVSVTSTAFVDDNGSMLCSIVSPNLTCFQLFTTSEFINEIVAITQKICYVDVHDA